VWLLSALKRQGVLVMESPSSFLYLPTERVNATAVVADAYSGLDRRNGQGFGQGFGQGLDKPLDGPRPRALLRIQLSLRLTALEPI